MKTTINSIHPYDQEIQCDNTTVAIIDQVKPIKVSSRSYDEEDKYGDIKKVYLTEASFDLSITPRTNRTVRVSYELYFYDSNNDKIYTHNNFNSLFFIDNQSNTQSIAKIVTEDEIDIYTFESASFKILYAKMI